jgi:hypothetical protein
MSEVKVLLSKKKPQPINSLTGSKGPPITQLSISYYMEAVKCAENIEYLVLS